MKLVGSFGSPYVRRVAISMKLLDVPFEHLAHRVFAETDAFSSINPLLKAPTLVCKDGTVLVDSTLILDWVEHQSGRSLMPEGAARARALRMVGLALAACDAAVQVYYEHTHRPETARHPPWLERRERQVRAALIALEEEAVADTWAIGDAPGQADVTSAVAWAFVNRVCPGLVLAGHHPSLVALSKRAEALPEFVATQPA